MENKEEIISIDDLIEKIESLKESEIKTKSLIDLNKLHLLQLNARMETIKQERLEAINMIHTMCISTDTNNQTKTDSTENKRQESDEPGKPEATPDTEQEQAPAIEKTSEETSDISPKSSRAKQITLANDETGELRTFDTYADAARFCGKMNQGLFSYRVKKGGHIFNMWRVADDRDK